MLTFKYVSVVRVPDLFHFGWSWRFMMRDIFNVKFLPIFFFNSSAIFLFKFISLVLFVTFLNKIDVKPLFLLKHH